MIVIKRAQHLWIAAAITSAILIGTTGVLVKRQFAQEKAGQVRPVQEQVASSTANHQPNPSDRFDSDGLEFERRLVKLAPFSATLVNENTQGSAPATVATSLIFRDAKGRTRRDRMQLQSNPSSPNADQQPQISTIVDPCFDLRLRILMIRRQQKGLAYRTLKRHRVLKCSRCLLPGEADRV